ncbi:type II secretion system F family protein [Nocardioides jensenii]|uniref:type II secretion system F family protein n=1 Tax=Nocardioides jensenii TaxID=1843 RepID=UPI000834F875|nr:type II secretion system F family protein [Nocardioides jensenii]
MTRAVLPALLAAAAVLLCFRARPSPRLVGGGAPPLLPVAEISFPARHRLVVSVCAALGGVTLVPLPLGGVVAVVAFVAVWVTIARAAPASELRKRQAAARDLPQVVQLLGLVLAAGGSLPEALHQVAAALPGPGTEPLRRADARLGFGMAPVDVWRELSNSPAYERVGRALLRAETSGVPIADVVRRLGLDLAREERARVEDRARTVGVRAAVPLGLLLLPAFLVVGIVPVIASALSSLSW